MSTQYDEYLQEHRSNCMKGLEWLRANLPDLLIMGYDYEGQMLEHDRSKNEADEYVPYDNYFYGGNRSYAMKQEAKVEFDKAWLKHIHRNPHHWQHWVLVHDEPNEATTAIDMPYSYIIEMICDWWTFSWKSGNLNEIFKWYDAHKDYMVLSFNTKCTVEHILACIKEKLEASNDQT